MSYHSEYCMGCMFKKGNVSKCNQCGWIEGTLPESPQHMEPGTILHDKYLVGRVLGQGGFGITYLGWDLQLDMKLAIKEYMPRDYATRNTGQPQITFFTSNVKQHFDYGLNKFLDEAKILAKYNNHPGIVSVRDFFKENGTAYLVMYYLDGVDLKKYLEQIGGTLSFEQALSIMTPVMDALATVHKDGILHRDISPDNIYITMTGEVKLLDFGAARHAINNSNKSLSVILKPGYAPEEQYRSKGKQGPWTDIYGTAATIYRIITGFVPPESLDRLEEDTLKPPSQLGVSIQPHVESALLKALSLKAQDRYQTMEEFLVALQGLSHSKTLPYQIENQNAPNDKTLLGSQQSNIRIPSNEHVQNRSPDLKKPKKRKVGLIIGSIIGGGLLLFILFIGVLLFIPIDEPTDCCAQEDDDKQKREPLVVNKKPVIDESVQVVVPRLYNLTEEEAVKQIQAAGLTVGEVIYQENFIAKKGRVVQQSINPDEKKGKNTPITIYINSGIELPVDVNTIYQEGMNLVNQYWDEAAVYYNNKEWETALKLFIQTRDMASELYKYNGNMEARFAEAQLANIMSSIKVEMGYPYYALEDSGESVSIFQELNDKGQLADVFYLGEAMGNLSWLQLLNILPEESVKTSEQAIKLDPTNILVHVNLAHGYLLTDNFKEAFKLYSANKDLDFNGQLVASIIAEDFNKLREAGYTHPDIDIIDELMLGNLEGTVTDELEIKRTIYYQTYAEYAEDLNAYMSTFTFKKDSQEYANLSKSYQNLFNAYDFTEALVNSITVEEVNGNQASIVVSKSFKYQDSEKEHNESVTYKFKLTKVDGDAFPWRIHSSEVVSQ
ncbi:serine/threonine protein kinase [Bacillus timonensis]|nr:serine/threonine protein kinase [Bacillus timonensis]